MIDRYVGDPHEEHTCMNATEEIYVYRYEADATLWYTDFGLIKFSFEN